ncbi:hypothetical protein OG824_27165 [Streptomyces prunicolor]|uniref:hypothetical protein n=1 Tax=Streptomyces prunicolor TaxID=67348 RepID=UPI00224CE992|nr:hypothetical protein [Streptomyces prunicolor]MCX5238888.1 hypothetical protein [Streptomyces prunicolor]
MELFPSDLDQRVLLHNVADRLNTVADHLPLPYQIGPDPALSEILDDEVRNLARLLGYLTGQHAFRHRAAANYPDQATATHRRVTLALAEAAEPTGGALAALSAAVHHLARLADLTQQRPGPGSDRARAITAAHQDLTHCIGESRTQLAHAAQNLRTTADTRTPPPATVPVPPTPSAAPSRTR